jgi:hypothetical protein
VSTPNVREEEISIPELVVKIQRYFRFLKKKQLTIWIFVTVMFTLGILTALTTEDEFEATNVVLSYSGPGGNAGMAAANRLAGLAGITLPTGQGMDTRAVNEMMIPTILNTFPVSEKLGQQPLRFYNTGETLTGIEYFSRPPKKTVIDYVKEYTIDLPIIFIQWVVKQVVGEPERVRAPGSNQAVQNADAGSSDTQAELDDSTTVDVPVIVNPRKDHLFVDQRTTNALTQLISRVTVEVEGNVITVKANMPDPYASADLAQSATDILMQELVNFEIRKTEEELEYLVDLYNESEEKYNSTLARLTELQDRLRNTSSASANIAQIRAAGDNEIARQQFLQITLRLEQARIKLKEDTPMFAVLNPVQIPQRAINENKIGVVIIFLFLGVFLGVGWVTTRGILQAMKAEAEAEKQLVEDQKS